VALPGSLVVSSIDAPATTTGSLSGTSELRRLGIIRHSTIALRYSEKAVVRNSFISKKLDSSGLTFSSLVDILAVGYHRAALEMVIATPIKNPDINLPHGRR